MANLKKQKRSTVLRGGYSRALAHSGRKPKPSFADVKDRIGKGVFFFEKMPGWMYSDDMGRRVVNRLFTHLSTSPHLILLDSHKMPRFALEYHNTEGKPFEIRTIQRGRTAYGEVPKGLFWNAKAETVASKKFQAQLRDMHPADFLLSEFLQQHSGEIRRGRKVILRIKNTDTAKKIYSGVIKNFFKTTPVYVDGILKFELSLRKKRARQALGIQ